MFQQAKGAVGGPARASILVVVSHFDAWASDQLVTLLDQMRHVSAGAAFDVCVVVNQCGNARLMLPPRFADVTVLHRPNGGYNIGAWDHGWRTMPPYEDYLFLQEECRILRPGWLAAFRQVLARPGVGLVGESLAYAWLSWDRLDKRYRHHVFADPLDGGPVSIPVGLRTGLTQLGIPVGRTGAHMQTLVIAMRRQTLQLIDGFIVADSYGAATVAECAISKKVEALGLKVREVGPGSFHYILHPQWHHRQGFLKAVARRVTRWLPVRVWEWLGSIRWQLIERSATAQATRASGEQSRSCAPADPLSMKSDRPADHCAAARH